MRLVFLGFGIMMISLAFDKDKRIGAFMLAIVVLSLLLTAQRKGILS